MFNVHRSSYKYWSNHPNTINAQQIELYSEVKAAHRISNGSAGARTIADIVTTKGIPLSRYRASKLMKKLDLVSCQLPKHNYKKAAKEHVEIPNTLKRVLSQSLR